MRSTPTTPVARSRACLLPVIHVDLPPIVTRLPSSPSKSKLDKMQKCPSTGTTPVSTPLVGRGPVSLLAPPSFSSDEKKLASSSEASSQQGGYKASSPSRTPSFGSKHTQASAHCSRLWYVSQALLIALVLVALASLLFFTLFAPYLAGAQEPLVIMGKGGQKLVVRVHSRSEVGVDPIADLTHPRLAGRRELMRYFEDSAVAERVDFMKQR